MLIVIVVLIVTAAVCYQLMIAMPGRSFTGDAAQLTPDEQEIRRGLSAHITKLAQEIGPRSYRQYESLVKAAQYVETELRSSIHSVDSAEYEVRNQRYRNIEATLRGSSTESIVVGAHYDSIFGGPGANDNGSGVAALLELAKSFSLHRPNKTIRFVAFVNEEPPFFQGPFMGSAVYAKAAKAAGLRIAAMVSLETMGYFSEEAGSQQYPFPVDYFYPNRGNFIAFVGNVASRKLVRQSLSAFRSIAQIPSEGAALPGWLPGVGWSDQWSFWKSGIPAIMVTDTAPFRYPYYHSAEDTPDKLDYERLTRVVTGIKEVILKLAA